MRIDAARVKKGASKLDRLGPENWFWTIDPDILRLDSYELCVLGQVFDRMADANETPYDAGLRFLSIRHGEAQEYGFVGPTAPAWIKEIEARRDASLKSVQDAEMVTAGIKTT